jgi:hypothetical protein
MQNERHMEIGLHNDLVTLQAVYNIDPVQFLKSELSWLRSNGINISGTASHGSPYCYTYKYLNFYFFEECTNPPVGQFVNNITLPLGGIPVPMKKGKLADFNLSYEAYFLNNNKYFSDASITAGVRWNIGMLDINKLVPGDRAIILLHPIHWHKASVKAEIESFHINGEESSDIDRTNKIITVRMPYGIDKSNLSASYVISPGAQAKIAGVLQTSGNHPLNLTSPVTLSIYAENRKVINDWTINVVTAQSNACDFESFTVTGFTGKIKINSNERRILAELNGDPDLSALKISFNLSRGAKAFIGATECFSNSVFIDFIKPVVFVVVAADGVTSSEWTVTIVQNTIGVEDHGQGGREMKVYPNPTNGKITLQFFDVTFPSLTIEIFNSIGNKVGSFIVNGTGDFSVTADLSEFPSGVYFIKSSGSSSPVKILLRKN